MDLRDYPRPKGDTGIGVHWNAGFASSIGLGQIEQIWLPRLRDMGIKWVKISNHDGGLGFAELLLKNDIMPIVRIYRPQPNPGTLSAPELKAVSDYVSAGVRYIEFNNEPDLGVEWQSREVPLDGAQISARTAIVDMEAVLQRGGYPGIPALRPGGRWDLVGEICRLGRRDLLSQPVWQALHNYSANHPLDYPYDRVNQEGAPCSQALFDKLAVEKWGGDAWEGWTLEQLNQFRRERANPGATAVSDATCWRGYERYDQLIRNQIGRSLPILATENGYVVGERQDKRYAGTTPQLHAIQTLEACRVMMGTSTLYDHAPDYYFCTAYWLLGNFALGSWAREWENAAWFSQGWPGGQLPIISALMAEPKRVRTWRGDAGLPGRLFGVIRNGPNVPLTIRLVRADGWLAIVQVAPDGKFELGDLPLARFTLTLVEAGISQEIVLDRDRPTAAADFNLGGVAIRLANSVLRGSVQGGAGMTVRLTRQTGNPWEEIQLVFDDGTYRFTELEPGTYTLQLIDTSVIQAGIQLDGSNEVVLDLAVPGWGWQVSDGGASPGFGIVRCRVAGRKGLPVRLWTAGWSGMTLRTGSKAEYGEDACEFAPLGVGTYKIQPEGIDAVAEASVNGSRVLWITFVEHVSTPGDTARASTIAGHLRAPGGAAISGGASYQVRLAGPDGEQTTAAADDGAYHFVKLPAGTYRVVLDGTSVAREDILLDGHNTVTVDLEVPGTREGAIFGVIANGGGRLVRLLLPPLPGPVAEVQADTGGHYRFEALGAGAYTVQVLASDPAAGIAAEQAGIAIDGSDARQVDFSLEDGGDGGQASGWTAAVEDGGRGPGSSVVRCQVEGQVGIEVRLWTSGWSGIVQRTGSKAEYGPDACEFAPLGSGKYLVEPIGLDTSPGQSLRIEVNLESNRIAWVRYRRSAGPVQPAARSVIAGSVSNGEGYRVSLTWPGGQRQATVSGERYRFEGLSAGVYRVAVGAADPALGEAAAREGVTVDGTNEVAVDFDLTEIGPAKTIDHYLLVGSIARTRDDFVVTMKYISHFRPAVGTDEAEARAAHHVTILGSLSAVSALIEQGLRMGGAQVQRIESDYAGGLGKLLAENRPY
jgi:hypothetical protein